MEPKQTPCIIAKRTAIPKVILLRERIGIIKSKTPTKTQNPLKILQASFFAIAERRNSITPNKIEGIKE
jgi:hypothetical protein